MKPKKSNKKKHDENINVLYFDKNETKTISKPKLIGLIIIILLILLIAIMYIIYAKNEKFRIYMDSNILNKQIEENDLKSIEIEDFDKSNIFAYSKYIAILNNNSLTTYNSLGKKEAENKIEISNPIVYSNEKYLMIEEQN